MRHGESSRSKKALCIKELEGESAIQSITVAELY